MDLTAGFVALVAGAFMLGAFHALEPGHGKTIMGAYIVASRGGVRHALLLGFVVTITHTSAVFLLAGAALYFASRFPQSDVAYWLGIVSASLVILVGAWMSLRSFGMLEQAHGHGHEHHGEVQTIETEHGRIEVSIFEVRVPPRFRVHFHGPDGRAVQPPPGESVTLETTRDDGAKQRFELTGKGDYLESTSEIPEPHQVSVVLMLTHDGHLHDYPTRFIEHVHAADHSHEAHGHSHEVKIPEGKNPLGFRTLILVGASGGLVPCPAALTAFLAALNLGQPSKGIAVVLALSLWIASTLITIGILFVKARDWESRRFSGNGLTTYLPKISAVLITLIGVGMLAGALMGHSHQPRDSSRETILKITAACTPRPRRG